VACAKNPPGSQRETWKEKLLEKLAIFFGVIFLLFLVAVFLLLRIGFK